MRNRPFAPTHFAIEAREKSGLAPASRDEAMARKIENGREPARELINGPERLLTAKDAADLLRLSPSWLAKARMRGDGPPYVKLGRSVRYGEDALHQWMKSHLRLSTSER
jgi:predicted DNA-binding transcriptional regulator AlpA